MDYINAKGIIVNQVDFNEADKMLTVLTDTEGLITVKAAGIKSFKRKDLAGAKPFIYGDYILTKHGDHYGIKECNIITPFLEISKDIEKLGIGFYILDIANNMLMPNEPNFELFRLTLNSIFALNKGNIENKLLKAAYEIKVCDIIGYAPQTFECMECYEEISLPTCYFDIVNGGTVCNLCCKKEGRNIFKVSAPTVNAINFVIDSDIKSFLSFKLKDEFLSEFETVCENFFILHSGYKPKTLDFLKENLE